MITYIGVNLDLQTDKRVQPSWPPIRLNIVTIRVSASKMVVEHPPVYHLFSPDIGSSLRQNKTKPMRCNLARRNHFSRDGGLTESGKKKLLPKIKDYPKFLVINGDTWDVRFCRKKIPGETENTRGLCDPSTMTIYILMGIGRAETFATFFHEFLHAAEDSFKIKLSHRVVYQLEEAVARVVMDNFAQFCEMFCGVFLKKSSTP